MRTILLRTLIGIAIAILISFLLYQTYTRSFDREIILFISIASLCCSVPIVSNYVISTILIQRYQQFLYFINISLSIFNAFLIIGTSLLTLALAANAPFLLSAFSYIVVGIYVFYETIQNFQKAKALNSNLSDEDILDDNFLK